MIRNTSAGYGWGAILLHWVIALLFIGEFALGWTMVRLESQRTAFELIQLHKAFGFLLLGLVVLRLGWRAANTRPDLPPTLGSLEAMAAHAAHWLLYVAMFVAPLTGWALVSVSVLDIPSMPFGLFVVPNLPMQMSDEAETFWAAAHEVLAWGAIAIVALHALAALRHHFWLKDDVLKRMIRP
ncbi:cytochrome b [Arvimicrobium flavum]|uniref:cytochrome b n=1 Tax=Arvimicrobium flavum TaxID=3393320 RepID=UPI00237B64AD|nr:cytochrome b [Mesorhizobium shangrilense]